MHRRYKIQSAIFNKLQELVNVNVYNGRWYPVPANKMPAVSVYAVGDSAEINGQRTTRREKVYIVLYDTGHDAGEETLASETLNERLAIRTKDIEDKLLSLCNGLENVFISLEYKGTKIKIDKTAEALIGIVELEYEAIYFE